MSVKTAIYSAAKSLGLFYLSRHLTRKKLRILCYHGVSTTDTHLWRPMLFMRMETFRKRMKILKEAGLNLLSLEDAVNHLKRNSLPPNSVVITIDDGFAHTATAVAPLLQNLAIPSTTYVTSYYQQKQAPIFRLVVQYLLWKSDQPISIDARKLGVPSDLFSDICISFNEESAWKIIDYGEGLETENERQELLTSLARALGIDFQQVNASRDFQIMDDKELQMCLEQGMDIQLHTRRHNFPSDLTICRRELEQNKTDLEPLVGHELFHFCYPSGQWLPEHRSILEAFNIESATTTDPGFNDANSNLLQLNRFLDSDTTSSVEFEAEINGFAELLRNLRNMVNR